MMNKRFNSWEELFNHWKKESEYYKNLTALRKKYDEVFDKITKPFHDKISSLVEDGQEVNAATMDKHYKELVGGNVKQLEKLYKKKIKQIEDTFDR